MSQHTYKLLELVGSSNTSIDDAIRGALSRAAQTMHNLDWFEVKEIRGHLENGQIGHFQVVLKVGFRLD